MNKWRKPWEAARKAAGICLCCSAERGKDGTKNYCRACANRFNVRKAMRSIIKNLTLGVSQ